VSDDEAFIEKHYSTALDEKRGTHIRSRLAIICAVRRGMAIVEANSYLIA